jgi:hypothetical protein
MGRLPHADPRHFEEHCITCTRCATAAEEAHSFVQAMNGGLHTWYIKGHD